MTEQMMSPGSGAHAVGAGAPGTAAPAGAPTTGPTGDVGEVSLGQLVAKVTNDLSVLMRQEIELAKAEMTTEFKKAGKGAGMLGGAGYAGHLTILFLSFALWWALASAMPIGWAALIVAVIWGVVAAILAVTGRKNMRSVRPKPERTIDTMREVPSALKP